MAYKWDFVSVFTYWDVLLIGLQGTLSLFAVCLVLGLGGGLIVGTMRYAHNPLVRLPATAFVEVFRNIPVLVQIIWFYFAFPMLAPIEVSPYLAAVLGMSLNTMAFSAEIYRGGIQSMEPGQWEAAKAIGMTYNQTLRRVILPQAIKRMLPALTNRGIEVFKMSTLASIVAYVETLQQAKLIASIEYNPIESYTVVAILFFVILYPIVQTTYALERRFGKSD